MTLNLLKKRKKILTLGIFRLVLFPNLTRIINLNAAIAFFTYENTSINLIMAILVKIILTLNHYKRVGKGSMRCCEQLMYIWLIGLTTPSGLVKYH
jgi:hypothetical protein